MIAKSYTVAEVLDRLEQEFGQRPTVNAVHKAAGRPRRANARASLVAGLPAPTRTDDGGTLAFEANAIDQWLQEHPRRVMQQALADLERDVHSAHTSRSDDDLRAGVAAARARGLSWAQVAEVFSRVDRPVSRQAVAERFGRYMCPAASSARASP